MIKILSIILLILLIAIGGKRGLKAYISLYTNLGLLFLLILLIGWGFNPLISSIVISSIILCVILFFLNGFNKKTVSSFISVIIVMIILSLLINFIGTASHISGYTEETIEEVGFVEYNTGLNILSVSKGIIIIGLIGAIIDTSIAISSALYEVHLNNKKLKIKELIKSGMNIGKDILGTTTNTLLFAFLGGFSTMIIYFIDFKYSIVTIINSKLFAQEFIKIMLSGIGCFIIIPVTAIITSYIIIKGDKIYEKAKYNI